MWTAPPFTVKKPRNKARLKLARKAVDNMAQSLQRAGIDPRQHTVRLGGQRTTRWKPTNAK